jgi:hypothetical protein
MMARPALRALNVPIGARVTIDGDGRPAEVDGRAVETVREEWRVEEGWWTDIPVRRRYFEIVLQGGLHTVVFEDRRSPARWYRQR